MNARMLCARSLRSTGVIAACLVGGSAFGAMSAEAVPARTGLVDASAVHALYVRSVALNQRYHLGGAGGRHAVRRAARAVSPSDSLCPCNADLPRRQIADPAPATECPCNAGLAQR